MATVKVVLDAKIGAMWTQAFKHAIARLNSLLSHARIDVGLSFTGAGPVITVKTDASIGATAVHGKAHTELTEQGRLLRSEVRLPERIVISTPRAVRPAGAGIYEVVAAHEMVHALGHTEHNTLLMAQTLQMVGGSTPGGDRLQAGSGMLPPIQLSDESYALLRGIWG